MRARGAFLGTLLLAPIALVQACARAEPRTILPVIAARNWEFDVGADGMPIPVYWGPRSKVLLCFEVDPAMDTTQWIAQLSVGAPEPDSTVYSRPRLRLARTVCFGRSALSWPVPENEETRLCAVVRDRFAEERVSESCVPVRWREAPVEHAELWQEASRVAGGATAAELRQTLDALDALAARAERSGLVALPVRIRLLAAGTATVLGGNELDAEIARRLAAMPSWLSRREASELAAKHGFELASLELKQHGATSTAWQLLTAAEQAYGRVAHSARIGILARKSELLDRVGASDEARRQLESAIAECDEPGRASCEPRKLADARIAWSWYTMRAPDASREELLRARDALETLAGKPSLVPDALRRGNLWIQVAYVELRLGREAQPALIEAGRQLAEVDVRAGWSALLQGWKGLLEGLLALERGDARGARARCGAHLHWKVDEDISVAAEALSCSARASRALGDLERAARWYEELLLLHSSRTPLALAQSLAVSSARQAEDYYEAARVAVERGELTGAWTILGQLDELAIRQEAARQCPSPLEPSRDAQRERERLRAAMSALSGPAAGSARAERARVVAEVSRNLQELHRELSRCAGAPEPRGAAVPDLRAVALDDEVLLLAHDRRTGTTRLVRRTAIARASLRESLDGLSAALAQRTLADGEWRRRAEPIARALAPPPELSGVLTYGLYGGLQRVPLVALPREQGWLTDRIIPAVMPAAAGSIHRPGSPVHGTLPREVYVVDPGGDLPAGPRFSAEIRHLRPRGELLAGGAATAAALRERLVGAAVLHVDAHARFEAAFPELSSLELADGPLQWVDLEALPAPAALVNLSACGSGAWPITADSGRFGLAGQFARRGTAWVVASRADLEDSLALDFNLELYRGWARGSPVPESFAAALRAVRQRYPAASWGGFLLLSGGSSGNGHPSLLPR